MRALALFVAAFCGLAFAGEAFADAELRVERVLVGPADGAVWSSDGTIDCPSTCSRLTGPSWTYTLTATPAPESTFLGWSGCDSVPGQECKVSAPSAPDPSPGVPVVARTTVTASFGRLYELAVGLRGAGSGTVRSAPAGIDCGGSCAASYVFGTTVELAAVPTRESFFAGWQGDCAGRDICKVTLERAIHVTATFGMKLAAGRPRASPRRPRAGAAFTLTLRLRGGDGARKAVCRARVRGGTVRLRSARVSRGQVACRWRLPRTARGGLLRATISAADAKSRVARRYAARVR